MPGKPNILLVHGAWGDASPGRHVIPLLHENDAGSSQRKTLSPRCLTISTERANRPLRRMLPPY